MPFRLRLYITILLTAKVVITVVQCSHLWDWKQHKSTLQFYYAAKSAFAAIQSCTWNIKHFEHSRLNKTPLRHFVTWLFHVWLSKSGNQDTEYTYLWTTSRHFFDDAEISFNNSIEAIWKWCGRCDLVPFILRSEIILKRLRSYVNTGPFQFQSIFAHSISAVVNLSCLWWQIAFCSYFMLNFMLEPTSNHNVKHVVWVHSLWFNLHCGLKISLQKFF